MLRVSNLKLGIDEDISLLKKLILKKLKIKERIYRCKKKRKNRLCIYS